jgi:hypothetical protein
MTTIVRLSRVVEYVIGYLGLSSLFLGALEALGNTYEPSEMWVWPILAVVIPALLGALSGLTDTAARAFSYWPLVVGSLAVDLVSLVRYRLSPAWITSNVHWVLLINVAAILSAIAAAWLVRRMPITRSSPDTSADLGAST